MSEVPIGNELSMSPATAAGSFRMIPGRTASVDGPRVLNQSSGELGMVSPEPYAGPSERIKCVLQDTTQSCEGVRAVLWRAL